VVGDQGALPILQPHWNEVAKPGHPQNIVSTIQILEPDPAGARYWAGAK
jgi:hypothetical protein